MELLATLSNEIQALAASAQSGVVAVDARRGPSASGVRWSDDLVVTAAHSIGREDHILVHASDGSPIEASLVGCDSGADVALLRLVNAVSGALLERQASEDIGLGALVLAVGRTAGHGPIASLGVMACAGERLLRPDIPPHPALLGAALLDVRGRWIGMLNRGTPRGGPSAVTLSTLERVVANILDRGQVVEAYLGLGMHPVDLPPRLGAGPAALALKVVPGGPADQAGLIPGDLIVGVDDREVRGVEDVLRRLGEAGPGDELGLMVLRSGEPAKLKVVLGSRPSRGLMMPPGHFPPPPPGPPVW